MCNMCSLVRLCLTNGCHRSMGEGVLWLHSPVIVNKKLFTMWYTGMFMERCGLTLWARCWCCDAMCGKAYRRSLKLTDTFWLFTPLPTNTYHTSVDMLWFDLNCLVVLYWIKDVFTTSLLSNETASLPFCFYSQEVIITRIYSPVAKGWGKCKERRLICLRMYFILITHMSLLSTFKTCFTPTRK